MSDEVSSPATPWLDPAVWTVVDQPGYAGKDKAARDAQRDTDHGAGNWTTAFRWGNGLIHRNAALQLYEDGYFVHLSTNPEVLEWLVTIASEVYDNGKSNVASGHDYAIQEKDATHLQDIAVRRCVFRLGRRFEGDHLVQIRGRWSEGYRLHPGRVPFHVPARIVDGGPERLPWIEAGSIEDFWQANKVVVVRTEAV